MKIKSNIHDYTVNFEPELTFFEKLSKQDKTVFIVDNNILEHYPQLFTSIDPANLIGFKAVESNKNLDGVTTLYKTLCQRDEKRGLTIVSVGGGIVQDVTGFVASTLYRGVNWIFVPTTFLAQADSCVGSKTSLNFDTFKNIIGGFYPPHEIYLCPEFLHSLPKADFYSGIGEVVKFLLLDDRKIPDIDEIKSLVDSLVQREQILDAIKMSLSVKQSYIAQDEFDGGKRNLFNYGHCFGHALESASDYAVPHGIAVTVGMMVANQVALQRGSISEAFNNKLNQELFLPIVPIAFQHDFFDADKIIAALKNDKKRVGNELTMIIPSSDIIDAVKVNDVKAGEVTRAMDTVIRELRFQ